MTLSAGRPSSESSARAQSYIKRIGQEGMRISDWRCGSVNVDGSFGFIMASITRESKPRPRRHGSRAGEY